MAERKAAPTPPSDEPYEPIPPSDEEVYLDGPALLANRFYITIGGAVVRLAFAEQDSPDRVPRFRTAVVLSSAG